MIGWKAKVKYGNIQEQDCRGLQKAHLFLQGERCMGKCKHLQKNSNKALKRMGKVCEPASSWMQRLAFAEDVRQGDAGRLENLQETGVTLL